MHREVNCRRPLSEKNANDAGEVRACIIIRSFLIVEFQRQLDISWRLRTCNLSHRGSQPHIGCVELDMVECVDEVGSELQSEPLREREVFMHTHVDVSVMGPTQPIELRRAVAKRTNRRICELSGVREPLNT